MMVVSFFVSKLASHPVFKPQTGLDDNDGD